MHVGEDGLRLLQVLHRHRAQNGVVRRVVEGKPGVRVQVPNLNAVHASKRTRENKNRGARSAAKKQQRKARNGARGSITAPPTQEDGINWHTVGGGVKLLRIGQACFSQEKASPCRAQLLVETRQNA